MTFSVRPFTLLSDITDSSYMYMQIAFVFRSYIASLLSFFIERGVNYVTNLLLPSLPHPLGLELPLTGHLQLCAASLCRQYLVFAHFVEPRHIPVETPGSGDLSSPDFRVQCRLGSF